MPTKSNINTLHLITAVLLPVFIWSASIPKDTLIWIAETVPLALGFFALFMTYSNYRLSDFTYFFIFVGALLMLIGAHYSYGSVPLGEWLEKLFYLHRNNYDKIGHFFQGFISALIIKEIIYIKGLIQSHRWTTFFSISFAIALSATWEILEWITAVIMIALGSKKPALDFIGAQDYVWDTQTDMFAAAIGAFVATVLLAKYHESYLVLSQRK